MNELVFKYGEWAFIAGAAEGIGAAFSDALAGQGMNLILVDKNLSSLNLLADHLEELYGIRTVRIFQDLSEENASQDCFENARSIDFRLMVYIPAFSPVRKFTEYTSGDIDLFLSLNARTPVHFVHSLLKNRH